MGAQPKSASLAMTALAIGAALSLATTATTIFTGPLALGIFRVSSLGYIAGFVVTLIIYGVAGRVAGKAGSTASVPLR